MGLSRIGIFFLFLFFSFNSLIAQENLNKNHVLYLMHTKEIESSFSTYQELCKESKSHDFELLQQMALILLQNGAKDSDAEIQQLSMFGAGISSSSIALDILEYGLMNQNPQTQMIALHFIGTIPDDRTQDLLQKAMNSDYLLTRMEAAYEMAEKKHPYAVGIIESLMYRLPPFFKPYFPSLFALIGTPEATILFKDLLHDPHLPVRIEAILNVGRFDKDDLLPIIRRKAKQASIAEQEACAFVLGILKDTESLSYLKKLKKSETSNIKISANMALYQLGDTNKKKHIEKLAKKENLFAIAALGHIPGSQEILAPLLHSANIQIRINAAISLLKLKDSRALLALHEVFIHDTRDLAFIPQFSIGHSLSTIKAIPSSELLSKKDQRIDLSYSLHLKEHLLKDALELPEKDFLLLAQTIFEKKQNELVPHLVALLENIGSENAKNLLKKYAQKMGAPLIRDYCNLALFRLKEEGLSEQYVTNWVLKQNTNDLIQLRPLLSRSERQSGYKLSPEEKSRLLIEMFLALASRQNEQCINVLIESMKIPNSKNRYALAGLLLRATE